MDLHNEQPVLFVLPGISYQRPTLELWSGMRVFIRLPSLITAVLTQCAVKRMQQCRDSFRVRALWSAQLAPD